jgi:ligand-binding sensor domain-containing protein
MQIKTLIFSIVLLLQFAFVSAQMPFYRNYNSLNGLPSSEVYDIFQDAKGYLWFSTDHGLARFDGYQFRAFDMMDGMPENTVFYFKSDKHGRIWFNTYTGMLGYIENDEIYSYRHNDKLLQFYTENEIRYVIFQDYYLQDNGSIHFNTFDKGTFSIDTSGVISQLTSHADADNLKIEIVENGQTIIKMPPSLIMNKIELSDGINTSVYDISSRNLKTYSQNFYNAKHIRKGKTYVSIGKTIFLFEGHTLIKELQLEHVIVRLKIDKEDNIWLATLSGGAYIFDSELKLKKRLFEGESITNFFQDHEGSLWLTSLNNGIYYIPDIELYTFSKKTGLPAENITDMFVDKNGTIWFANKSNNLGKITRDEVKLFPLSLPGEIFIQKLMPDLFNERLFIATNEGFYQFDYTTEKITIIDSQKHLPEIMKMKGVKSMVQDPVSGVIYRGHFSGISNLLPDGTSSIHTYTDNTFLKRVENLAIDKNASLWLGTSVGLYCFSEQKFSFFGVRFPLLNERITALAYENDSLWIGTRGKGLLLLHNDSLIQFTVKDGLVSNSISAILLTSGYILAGTNKGVSVMMKKRASDNFIVHNLVAGSGLTGNEVAAIAQLNNQIYVATPEGISIFDNIFEIRQINMPIHITTVTIENRNVDFSKPLEIPFNEKNLSVDYFAISYYIQGRHTYRHRLLGLEDEWIVNQKTTAQYPYLPPGNYSFEVQVLNPDGNWSPTTAAFDFTVLKPFWQKWWFLLTTFLIAFALITYAFRLAHRITNKRKQLLADLNKYRQEALSNQMNPHFLFNALNTVQRYILENDKMESSKYLNKFSNLMRTMLNNAQKQHISIKQEMEALSLYLELEAARFKDRFDFSIDYDKTFDVDDVKIPVFLIQPLVENAIWHGLMNSPRHGILKIAFTLQNDYLICEITDNGIGRTAAAKLKSDTTKKSLGVSIIQKRLSLMNINNRNKTSLSYKDITDNEGNIIGTQAIIRFPAYYQNKAINENT